MADTSVQHAPILRQRWEQFSLFLVQCSVIVAIVYSTWHFGAVQSLALQRLCWIAAIGLVAAFVTTMLRSESVDRLPTTFWILLTIWIVYAFVQTTPLPTGLNIWFSRAARQADLFRNHAADLSAATKELADIRPIEPPIASGTAIREATFQSLVPYLLALAFSVLAAIGFHTDRPRNVLLWAIIGNATLMAMWGIVQRSGGGAELLPVIENRTGGIPFGSFVYKNAGAAALLPALACLVAVILMRNRNRASHFMMRAYTSRTRGAAKQLDSLFVPICLFAGGILITGLITSVSRGAWLAALMTLCVVFTSMRTRLRSRRVWVTLAGVMLLTIGIVVVTGLAVDIQQHAKRVSVGRVSADQRWSAWVDGFQTAIAHLPSGSGLGTYGYASLAFQDEPRIEWFREAHNQYLETFTETGLIGISIVMLGMVWFGRTTYRLMQTVNGRMRLGSARWAWGMIGIALLVCGAVQNAFDFVIKVPAILMLYSILVTVVATTRLHAKVESDREPAIRTSRRAAATPLAQAVWLAVGLIGIVGAERIANRQVLSDRALGASVVTGIASDETEQDTALAMKKLDAAIANQPGKSILYLRRAIVGEQKYQQRLMEVARQSGTTLSQQNSRMETIHALLSSTSSVNREAYRADFLADSELRETLAETIADLQTAVLLNPYHPHSQYQCALISPLGGYAIEPWLSRSMSLANNHHQTLFNNGLLAYYQNDHQRMVQQWSKTLSIHHQNIETILELAAQRIPVTVVAKELVPASRPNFIVDLGKKIHATQSGSQEDSPIHDLVEFVQNSTGFAPADRHATLAGLYRLLGNQDLAISHWKQSLKLQPMNSRVRVSLVTALSGKERWEDALDHAVLGQRLFPGDNRFERQARLIRRRMLDF